MTFLIISVLIKQFVFDATFSEYAIEFIAFFGACFYILIRSIWVGNNIYSCDSQGNRLIIVNSLVIGVTITATALFLQIRDKGNINGIVGNSLAIFIVISLAIIDIIIYKYIELLQ